MGGDCLNRLPKNADKNGYANMKKLVTTHAYVLLINITEATLIPDTEEVGSSILLLPTMYILIKSFDTKGIFLFIRN